MNYLVMECHPGYVVLLDEEGRFLKAANLHYEVGQTIQDPVLMKEATAKPHHTARWISGTIAAIAACLLLVFGFQYYQNFLQPYSSIRLMINPEVQMDLNRQGTVVGLTGTNDDGRKLLEGYDGKGKDKVTVADELIDRAIEMGFLSEGGQVSFSIDAPDEILFQEYGVELRTKVTQHLDGRITVTIEIINSKNGQHEQTLSNGGSNVSSQPDETPSAASVAPSAPVPSSTPETPSISGNNSDYDDTDYGGGEVPTYTPPASVAPPAVVDTDYGAGNDGVTDYTPPASTTPPAAVDTDYGAGSDGVTDYTPPASSTPVVADTDYGAGNDGVTDYNDDDADDSPGNGGDSNYDSDDDDSDDSGDDDDDDE